MSSLKARYRSETFAITHGLLGLPVRLFRLAYKETLGSLKLVLSLTKGSRLTLWIYALLLDPGGVLITRLFATRTSAFHSRDNVGFPALKKNLWQLS